MKSMLFVVCAFVSVTVFATGCRAGEPSSTSTAVSKKETAAAAGKPARKTAVKPVRVQIQTNVEDVAGGVIEMELYPDKAPKTVENFVKLAGQGFYDGVLFHRVVPGFVIQGGDPLTRDPAMKSRWGSGGPDYRFADEPVMGEYTRGAVAMANAGPNTNGSQFFICVNDLTGRLPKQYNYFGQVTKGMEVVDAIIARPRDRRDCPLENVVMKKVTVL